MQIVSQLIQAIVRNPVLVKLLISTGVLQRMIVAFIRNSRRS